jgi:hypothetical protein
MGRCDWGRSSGVLKKSASGVLSPVSPCDVPSGYASVAPLLAALLDGLFEHPAKAVLCYAACVG